MYITDKRFKQGLCSYIKYTYGVEVEPNRIYVFKYDYSWDTTRSEYAITQYKECVGDPFPSRIPANEVDKWGMILSRKDKINKIKSKYNDIRTNM